MEEKNKFYCITLYKIKYYVRIKDYHKVPVRNDERAH